MFYNHFNKIKNFVLDTFAKFKRVGISGKLTTTIGRNNTPVPTPKISDRGTITNIENKPKPTNTLATNVPTLKPKLDKTKKTIKKKSIKSVKKKRRKK